MRVGDFGNAGEEGDSSTAHDPTYFPPDLAALLPDGRHTFETNKSLAAANNVLLDLRGLGMALIKGYAGKLPAEVCLEGMASCASSGPLACSASSAAGCNSYSSAISSQGDLQEDKEEGARLLRIARHDWAASIDALIPDAPALNQLAKLLLGPKQQVPCLAQLLQQPLIKAVHRRVLDTARRARKPWQAHVSACRAAVWQVAAPLMQLEQELMRDAHCSNGTISSLPPLSRQFELLGERFLAKQQQQQGSCSLTAVASCRSLANSECSSLTASVEASSSSCTSCCYSVRSGGGCCCFLEACAGDSCASTPTASSLLESCAMEGCCTPTPRAASKPAEVEDLQAAVAAVMAQLAAARPDAATRIAQLQQELTGLAAGTAELQFLQPPQSLRLRPSPLAAAARAASATPPCRLRGVVGFATEPCDRALQQHDSAGSVAQQPWLLDQLPGWGSVQLCLSNTEGAPRMLQPPAQLPLLGWGDGCVTPATGQQGFLQPQETATEAPGASTEATAITDALLSLSVTTTVAPHPHSAVTNQQGGLRATNLAPADSNRGWRPPEWSAAGPPQFAVVGAAAEVGSYAGAEGAGAGGDAGRFSWCTGLNTPDAPWGCGGDSIRPGQAAFMASQGGRWALGCSEGPGRSGNVMAPAAQAPAPTTPAAAAAAADQHALAPATWLLDLEPQPSAWGLSRHSWRVQQEEQLSRGG